MYISICVAYIYILSYTYIYIYVYIYRSCFKEIYREKNHSRECVVAVREIFLKTERGGREVVSRERPFREKEREVVSREREREVIPERSF